ncbi:MAG: GGDEF domain-containing protein, partial [Bacteroidaceae bacterium]|nr:GGDEF domain-containing protein [Bacteroidaceae bacterium]
MLYYYLITGYCMIVTAVFWHSFRKTADFVAYRRWFYNTVIVVELYYVTMLVGTIMDHNAAPAQWISYVDFCDVVLGAVASYFLIRTALCGADYYTVPWWVKVLILLINLFSPFDAMYALPPLATSLFILNIARKETFAFERNLHYGLAISLLPSTACFFADFTPAVYPLGFICSLTYMMLFMQYRLAHTTPSVNIENNLLFFKRLHRAYHKHRGKDNRLVVGMLDADRLKAINDVYGHDGGENALKQIVWAVSDVTRNYKTWLMLQTDGDEMYMIIEDCDIAEANKIKANIQRILEDLTAVLPYILHASIGFVQLDEKHTRSRMLYEEAERLMYEEKKEYYR